MEASGSRLPGDHFFSGRPGRQVVNRPRVESAWQEDDCGVVDRPWLASGREGALAEVRALGGSHSDFAGHRGPRAYAAECKLRCAGRLSLAVPDPRPMRLGNTTSRNRPSLLPLLREPAANLGARSDLYSRRRQPRRSRPPLQVHSLPQRR